MSNSILALADFGTEVGFTDKFTTTDMPLTSYNGYVKVRDSAVTPAGTVMNLPSIKSNTVVWDGTFATTGSAQRYVSYTNPKLNSSHFKGMWAKFKIKKTLATSNAKFVIQPSYGVDTGPSINCYLSSASLTIYYKGKDSVPYSSVGVVLPNNTYSYVEVSWSNTNLKIWLWNDGDPRPSVPTLDLVYLSGMFRDYNFAAYPMELLFGIQNSGATGTYSVTLDDLNIVIF